MGAGELKMQKKPFQKVDMSRCHTLTRMSADRTVQQQPPSIKGETKDKLDSFNLIS